MQLDRINGGLPVIDSYHWFSSDATHSANPSQLKGKLHPKGFNDSYFSS